MVAFIVGQRNHWASIYPDVEAIAIVYKPLSLQGRFAIAGKLLNLIRGQKHN